MYPVDHASLPTKIRISTNEASARWEPLGLDTVVYTEYADRNELFRYGNGPRTGMWVGRDSLQVAISKASGRYSFFGTKEEILLGSCKDKDIGELCSYCEAFLLGTPWENFRSSDDSDPDSEEVEFLHQPGYAALLESARSCFLCFVLLRSLEVMFRDTIDRGPPLAKLESECDSFETEGSETKTKDQISIQSFSRCTLDSTIRRVWCCWKCDDFPTKFHFYGELFTLGRLDSDTSIISRTIWRDWNSDNCDGRLKTIKNWLDDCNTNHPECIDQTEPPLPTRVIDIGSPDGSVEPQLLLTHGRQGHYIAVSYCWGEKANFPKRKTSEVSDQGNVLQDLPRLFYDIISLARQLKIRYLWIDAFCILQGVCSDWERESACMFSYYNNAYLTFAAAAAENPESRLMKPFVPSVVRSKNGASFAIRTHDCHINHNEEPLYSRAWTLQEELLSKRVLYFGDCQLYWQCGCLRSSEDSILDPIESLFPNQKSRILHAYTQSQIKTSNSEWYGFWYEICRNYSARNITKESDWMPALYGLSTYFEALLDDEAILGLWKTNFIEGLCWERDEKHHRRLVRLKETKRNVAENMPSWSWLSLGETIKYQSMGQSLGGDNFWKRNSKLRPHAEVVSVNIDWTRTPIFSKIASTELILRGRLVEIRHKEYDRERGDSFRPYAPHSPDTYLRFNFDIDLIPDKMWALELASTVISNSDATSRPGDQLFLYLTLSENQPEKYSRVGIGYCWFDSNEISIFANTDVQTVSLV